MFANNRIKTINPIVTLLNSRPTKLLNENEKQMSKLSHAHIQLKTNFRAPTCLLTLTSTNFIICPKLGHERANYHLFTKQ